MDPDAAHGEFRALMFELTKARGLASADSIREEVIEIHQSLAGWLQAGGFEPDWSARERDQFIRFDPVTCTIVEEET